MGIRRFRKPGKSHRSGKQPHLPGVVPAWMPVVRVAALWMSALSVPVFLGFQLLMSGPYPERVPLRKSALLIEMTAVAGGLILAAWLRGMERGILGLEEPDTSFLRVQRWQCPRGPGE